MPLSHSLALLLKVRPLMICRLRVLAAFFMVPVVLFVNPQTASAAGPWTTVRIEVPAAPFIGDSGPGTIDTIDCTFSLRQTGGVIDQSTGACYGLPDVTPGYTQPGEAGENFAITVRGLQDPSGVSCDGARSGVLGAHSANGTLRVAGTIPSGTIYAGDGDCAVTEVCIDLGVRNTDPACVDVDIPPMGEPEEDLPPNAAGCVHGYPAISWEWREGTPDANGNIPWQMYVEHERYGAPMNTTPWVAGVRWNDNTTTAIDLIAGQIKVGSEIKRSPASGPPTKTLVGLEAAAIVPGGINEPVTARIYSVGATRPTLETHSYFGWTQPQHCRYYFGQKVADDVNSLEDEPEGAGLVPWEPPPDDEPEPVVDPPEDDPDDTLIDFSWLWGILDAIRRALSSLAGAIAGLANAIVNGIKGALQDLFVPEDDFMESKWTGVEAKWDDTSPGKYLDTFSAFDTGSVSGCGGLPLNVNLGGGVTIDEHIGAACSGSMATAAGISRAVITAVFAIAGALACVRAIGSGLGWDPGIGKGNAT